MKGVIITLRGKAMLIKERDKRDEDIVELRRLLDSRLTEKQRFLIERELKCISSGARGEDDSAYYIDFKYKDSQNWAIIHDLRLEYRGFAAQVDHLLINRFLDFYVLESKNYHYGVKITPEGEFLVWNGKSFSPVESPIEQNKRHVELLQRVTGQHGFMPTRLGIPISSEIFSYVLVAPASRIDRPAKGTFDTSMVVKADAFVAALEKKLDGATPIGVFSSLAKVVSPETLENFARRLVRLHRPAKIDFAAKFGVDVSKQPDPARQPVAKGPAVPVDGSNTRKEIACEACGAIVDGKVAFFCRMNKARFQGKILCRSCQATVTGR